MPDRVGSTKELPTGTVTFVFTDIEGSTALNREMGDEAWGEVLAVHDRIVRDATEANGGVVVNTEGDAFFLAFDRPTPAVRAAVDIQIALGDEAPTVRVRVGVHTGEARLGGTDYVGMTVVQAARVSAAGHGGQILLTGSTRGAIVDLPPTVSLQPLGTHRLKDLGEPLELHQVCHPKLEADFPALRTLDRVSHNIPVQLTSFLGRESDLRAATELLRAHRLVTVLGPGGTGKTRFAYQLAAEEAESFPDGIWVVELAALADPAQVASAALASLGLREDPGRSPIETLVGWFSTRTALLVLDNCEHLIDAAAELAGSVLKGAPASKIASTSREALRVPGETVLTLAPLSTPDIGCDDPTTAESVRLFVERATAADTRFHLDATNAAAVAEICTRLEGMPLAIELAAAWARSLTPSQIAQRLGSRFQLLDKGARGSDARQASLRAAITWSVDLLDDAERLLLTRLSVFEGGWTLDAAETVCGSDPIDRDDVLPLMDALVDKSLVARSETGDQSRFRMLETIRAFAADERPSAGGEPVEPAHAEYFAGLAAESASEPQGSVGQARFFDRLDTDASNLRVAIARLVAAGRIEAAARMAIDLTPWWQFRGHWRDGHATLAELLGAGCVEPATAARLHVRAGLVAAGLSAEGFEEFLLEGARLAGELGEDLLEAEALDGLGRTAFGLQDYDLARSRHEEALAIGRRVGDTRSVARSRVDIADLDYKLGRFEAALSGFEEGLRVFEDIGDRQSECEIVLALLTLRLEGLRDLEGAENYGLRGLRMARELGYPQHEATALQRLAYVHFRRGDMDQAAELGQAAVGIFSRMGNRLDELRTRRSLSDVETRRGNFDKARHVLLEEMPGADMLDLADERINFRLALADLELAEGRHREALVWAEAMLGMAGESGSGRLLALNRAGRAALALGRLEDARAFFADAIEDAGALARPQDKMQIQAAMGDLCRVGGEHGAARDWYERALEAARQLGPNALGSAQKLLQVGLLAAAADLHDYAVELIAAGRELDDPHRAWAFEKQEVETALGAGAEVLGEAEFDAASERGRAMDWETASARAAELLDRLGGEDLVGDDGGGLGDVDRIGAAPHGQ